MTKEPVGLDTPIPLSHAAKLVGMEREALYRAALRKRLVSTRQQRGNRTLYYVTPRAIQHYLDSRHRRAGGAA